MNPLLEENFSQADTQSQKVTQCSHSTKRFFSGKGKVSEYKLDEAEFIDDFDLLIDEVEEDIRIEESLSSPESNPHSSKSKNVFEEIEDQSIIDVETRDESVTWMSDIGIEGSLLSSCDEVAAINDGILEVVQITRKNHITRKNQIPGTLWMSLLTDYYKLSRVALLQTTEKTECQMNAAELSTRVQ